MADAPQDTDMATEGYGLDFDWDATMLDAGNLLTPTPTFGGVFHYPPPNPDGELNFEPLPLPPKEEQHAPPQPGLIISQETRPVLPSTISPGTTSLWGGESGCTPLPLHGAAAPLHGGDIVQQFATASVHPPLPPAIALPQPPRPRAEEAAGGPLALPFSGFGLEPQFPFDPVLPAGLAISQVPHLLPDDSVSAPVTRAPSTRNPTPAPRASTAAPPSRHQSPGDGQVFELPSYSPDGADMIPKKTKGSEIDYAKYYARLPETPAPFLGKFQYNRDGEWKGHLHFDTKDISAYIKGRRAQNLPLRVWIQNMPAGCNDRGGMDPRTRKCRWSRCAAKHNTILKGFWRVAFDERPDTSGSLHDPFMNAGYFHLFCFEECFDLIGLIGSRLDVRPENRAFRREPKNPMAITRDCQDLLDTYNEWMRTEFDLWVRWLTKDRARRAAGLPGQRRERRRENHLWYQLTVRHLQTESIARQAVRNQRAGISIDKHLGDLVLYTRLSEERVADQRNKRVLAPRGPRDRDDEVPEAGPRHLKRPRRRQREEDESGSERSVVDCGSYSFEDDASGGAAVPTRRSKRIADIKSRDASPLYAHHPQVKRQQVEAPVLDQIDAEGPGRHGRALDKLITDSDSIRLPPSHRDSKSRMSFP